MGTAKEPLGKLYFNPGDTGALKCLVAVGLTKRKVSLEPVNSGKGKGAKKLLFTSAKGNVELSDAFSIAWFLAHYDNRHANKGYPDLSGANIVQWNSFSNAEIRPFLSGLLKSSKITARRDVASANKIRKNRLIKSLDVLNEILMKRHFLAGAKFSLADVVVAADLAPILEQTWVDQFELPQVKDIMKKHYVYVREWYNGVSSRNIFRQGLAQISLSAKVAKSLLPNEKGDQDPANLNVKNEKPQKKKAPPKSKGPDMTKIKRPLRVLCLHGYRQNGTSFREKLGSFRKLVGKYVEFTFITAPHRVLPMSNEDINQDQRGWWFSRESDYFKADDISDCNKGFDESLELIQKTFDLQGPFDGILGFSQGAALAALLCLMQERKSLKPSVQFNFAVMIAGFKSRSSIHAEKWYEENNDFKMVSVPTLHVMGYDDHVIPKSWSDELLNLFEKPNALHHQGGHYVPAKGDQRAAYFRFLSKVSKVCNPDVPESSDSSEDVKKVDENENPADPPKMVELNGPLDDKPAPEIVA